MNPAQAEQFMKTVERFVTETMQKMSIDPVEVSVNIKCAVRTTHSLSIEKDPRE